MSGAWERDFAWASVRDWGAVGDGVTDDSDAIQHAIDYLTGATGSGLTGWTLYFPDDFYKCSVINKNGVALTGTIARTLVVRDDVPMTRRVTLIAAKINHPVIDTPSIDDGGASGTAIRGFVITGKNVDGSLVSGTSGIRIQAGTKNSIDYCDFYNHDNSAIVQTASDGDTANGTLSVTNCTALGCMKVREVTVPTGVFDLRGTNGEVHWCEVSGSSTARSAHGNQVSILIGGGDWALSNVLAEYSDINWYFIGARVFGVNLTGDNSAIHNYVFSDCTDTRISGLATRTGQHPKYIGNDPNPPHGPLYEDCNAVHVIGTSLRNVVSVHVTLPGDTFKATHAVYETLNTPYAEYKNDFTGCLVERMSDGSMAVSGVPYVNLYPGGGSPMPTQIASVAASGATPNVNGYGFLYFGGGGTITNLLNGTAGQRVTILFDQATTVAHGGAGLIFLFNGKTRAFPAASSLTLKNYGGSWYEEGYGDVAPLTAWASWTPGAINNAASAYADVTVAGAAVGDYALASYSADVSPYIQAANVTTPGNVRVTLTNLTGSPQTIAALTVYVKVQPKLL